MSEILCSTGALIGRPNGRDYRLLKPLSKQLNFDGFEFMMYSSWYEKAESLVEELLSAELYIPVMHCEKHIGETITMGGKEELAEAVHLFEINCKIAKTIKAGKMVIHLWDGELSDRYFENNLKAYPYLKEIADGYQIDLLVENVVCNHENPMKHWCLLAEKYPHIHFVFDTKMAAFHNQVDLLYSKDYEWLWKYKHICHYHVNDYAGGYMDWDNLRTLPIGKGNVDFQKFFEHIHKTGYDGTFTVEATAFNSRGIVDVEMLNNQLNRIKTLLQKESMNIPG